ncbi:MAG: hypothetical protein AB1631_26420 [Acidobacteriota bacterium]
MKKLSASLIMLTLAFALPLAYAQRRAPAKPQLKAPTLTVYGKGYQKGYSHGYNEGERDYSRSIPQDFKKSDGWRNRRSAFDQQYATADDYIEGYELGFKLGYSDGYYGRAYSAAVPANGETLYKAEALARARDNRNRQSDDPSRDRRSDDISRPRSSRPIDMPAETDLRIRLTSPISTKTNKVGDKFTAEVLTPPTYEGATIEGHISSLDRSGKISGRTEMSFTFDTITLVDGRSGPISAHLEKIFESETVKEVDEEGNIRTGSRTKDSQVRGGVGATAGAIIGAIAGGVKGAILGAVIGGGAGVGTVAIEGKKDIILDSGTEMIIRTDRSRAR